MNKIIFLALLATLTTTTTATAGEAVGFGRRFMTKQQRFAATLEAIQDEAHDQNIIENSKLESYRQRLDDRRKTALELRRKRSAAKPGKRVPKRLIATPFVVPRYPVRIPLSVRATNRRR